MQSECIGISVGEAFIDLTYQNKHQRFYHPKEGIKKSILKFITTHSIQKISFAHISLEYLEKVLRLNVGSSVAQVTTQGFENWSNIRNSKNNFSIHFPENTLLGIKERISSDGQIIRALNIEDLDEIEKKIQSLNIKKVAIHFLHAHKNPQHQILAAKYFKDKNYEVFTPEASETMDEVIEWKTNLINAFVDGVFQDLKKDINEILTPYLPVENIRYSEGSPLSAITINQRLRAQFMDKQKVSSAIYLGLEKFLFFDAKAPLEQWSSPWGLTQIVLPYFKPLSIQPLSVIDLNVYEEIDFSNQQQMFDPGPICFGRGMKLTFFDLWANEIQSSSISCVSDQIIIDTQKKIQSHFLTLQKKKHHDHIEELKILSIQKIALECELYNNYDSLTIFGPLAPTLGKSLQKHLPHIQILNADFIESQGLTRTI